MGSILESLLSLSHQLGDPNARLAILAEGNASAKTETGTFWIKASGCNLGSLSESELVEVEIATILAALDKDLTDDEVRAELKAACKSERMPSVETFMHAWLLTLPDIAWVAHTHPTALLSILAVQGAKQRAALRLFPDEVVCCGPKTCFVPYVDPGLPLARAIRAEVTKFIEKEGELPKTIWLNNHGLIVLGRSASEAWSGTYMSEKAAQVWLGALSTGCELVTLTPDQVARIHTRPDEHYRQRLLWQVSGSAL